uniref:Tropomodulin-4 n=1 Tax=Amazona collaria TaxID=241587 RepID=A0A8B9IXZ2_9PSIT
MPCAAGALRSAQGSHPGRHQVGRCGPRGGGHGQHPPPPSDTRSGVPLLGVPAPRDPPSPALPMGTGSLPGYRDIDEDKILRELSAEELEQLDTELMEMDPENVLLPAGLRQRDQTHKSPTGPLDREALLQHLEKQALEAAERQDLVPFTGEKKGPFVPKN